MANKALAPARKWFKQQGWKAFEFQENTWKRYLAGESGLLNAPTGSGKTYALWLACLLEAIQQNNFKRTRKVQVIWLTPLRALAEDIKSAMIKAVDGLEGGWEVAVRSGDTSASQRQKIKKSAPECLITTPESLHLLLSQKDKALYFQDLKVVVADEWHELLGTKRGVQVELALASLKSITKQPLKIWGISATIGNLEQAKSVLLGSAKGSIVKANVEKALEIHSIIPEKIENFPWAGHLGVKLMAQVMPVIYNSRTTLLFTNTRSQTEIWYQKILEKHPDLAGQMAMHHGSLDQEVRSWVENALHEGKLKLVVCTSSLDLGVDFRPVDTVIQVGSPKGVARFLQRAGRSGHQPGAKSVLYFVPTHALELVEAAALKQAITEKEYEARWPLQNSFDVLCQFLMTLAVGEGFKANELFILIKQTHAYQELQEKDWQWLLTFLTTGGKSLEQYDEYAKMIVEDGVHKVINRRTAMRHRMHMGTIVSDPMVKLKYTSGGYIGSVEEGFISKLNSGDTFWFAGRSLEFVRLNGLNAQVKRSNKKTGLIPKWMGGRMPLSSQLARLLQEKLSNAADGHFLGEEMQALKPLLQLQQKWSAIPESRILLIEHMQSREGDHLFFFTFGGRFVHEVLAALVAYRIGKLKPLSFSIAMNDYGFELLSDQNIPIEEALSLDLFSTDHLKEDIAASINEAEMAKRKFRDIAAIAGLVFMGYPGKLISYRHLQASSQLLFDVFSQYEPDNLLLKQAREEVLTLQLDFNRLLDELAYLNSKKIVLKKIPKPTPFAFPIMVDRLREKLSSEKLEDRIKKMQLQLEDYARKGESKRSKSTQRESR